MKRVVVGIITAVAVAFAAQAAYSEPAAPAAQPVTATPLAAIPNATVTPATRVISTTLVTPTTPTEGKKPAPAVKKTTATKPTTGTASTKTAALATGTAPQTDNSFSNPTSVAEYNFAFVDPQAIADPMTDLSVATKQAVQDTLSPSSPTSDN